MSVAWPVALLIAFALLFFFDIVVGMRRDELGHRTSLSRRWWLWAKRMFDAFLSS